MAFSVSATKAGRESIACIEIRLAIRTLVSTTAFVQKKSFTASNASASMVSQESTAKRKSTSAFLIPVVEATV